MKHYVLLGLVTACAFTSHARSNEQQAALTQILEATQVVCASVPLSGSSSTLALDGKAKAEVGDLIKRLTDLGIDGAAKFLDTNYSGVLQSELASLVRDGNECRFSVLKLLSGTLLGANLDSDLADDRINTVSIPKSVGLLVGDQATIYTDDVLSAAVMTASVDKSDNQWINFSLLIENKGPEKVKISYPKMVPENVVAFDDIGKSYKFYDASGVLITQCNISNTCPEKDTRWTTMMPGSRYTFIVRARSYKDGREPSSATLAVNLLVKTADGQTETRSIGFPGVVLIP